jgi:GH25 family lysozyme M1 (1,4-beta-N-acetylmuramidase)
MKQTGAKIAKGAVSILLAATMIFSMSGCSKTAAKSLPKESLVQLQEMNFNTEEHAYIYDTTVEEHIEVTRSQQNTSNNVYIKINGDYFPTAELDQAIKTGQNIGLIVTPYNYTYESIYKTIDMIKKIVMDYDIDLGIYYDIDKYMEPETIRANVLLGEMFCLKLTANGVYCGFYGSSDNLEQYTQIFPEYVDSHSIDLFDKLVRTDDKEKTIDYNGTYHSAEYENGLIFSRFNMAEVIEEASLNTADNFVNDYQYIVESGDSITSIAKQHNIKVSDLVAYNNIEDSNLIQIGQIIRIPNQFTDVSTLISSMENGEVINQTRSKLVKGIDVSSWQGEIDWSKVSKQADFAIVRVLEASVGEDDYAYNNLKGCEENNLSAGCYWFSYALTPEEAEQEAQKVVDILDSYQQDFNVKLEYPIFIDIEWSDQLALGENSIREIVEAAAKVIENHGYTFGVYINSGNYEMVQGCGYPLWMTSSESYNKKTDFDKFKQDSFSILYKTNNEKTMWQYSQRGTIDGINGEVDINYATSNLKNRVISSEGYKLQ